MLRIAVISDTHNVLPIHLIPDLETSDEIWHLGDVTDEKCLHPLLALNKPLHVVRGNCDSNIAWPWVHDLEREGFLIRLIHIPPDEAPPGVDLLFHGHTHVPRNERVSSARFYNPGTIGKPNKGSPPSYAWLTLEKGKTPKWEIVPV